MINNTSSCSNNNNNNNNNNNYNNKAFNNKDINHQIVSNSRNLQKKVLCFLIFSILNIIEEITFKIVWMRKL